MLGRFSIRNSATTHLVIKKNPTAVYAGSFRFSLEYEILAVVRRFLQKSMGYGLPNT